MTKLISIFLIVILLCFSLTSCEQNIYPISATEFLMSTVIKISIYDGNIDALNSAIELCRYYDKLLSKTEPSSDIYKVNNSNGQPITVSNDTVELINKALEISEKSDNAFNPTVLQLVELWDVKNRTIPPNKSDIENALKSVNCNSIKINGNQVTAFDNAKLDLGGIAKGYIADKVKAHLIESGITSAVINLGGNTMLLGDKKGKPFTVGIQKPFGQNGETIATLELKDKTCVTSGIYQQYFEYENKIYHHIINTATGYPFDNNISSVTVITDNSATADGLSTACLGLGIEEGSKLAKQYSAELIFILTDGQLVLTDGLTKTTHTNETIITIKN